MSDALNFDDGAGWPKGAESRFVDSGGLRWRVQFHGQGPHLLLVHGTGSSAHSWRRLVPLLKERFTIVAPDLPGHAFTGNPGQGGLTLPRMASALSGLMQSLSLTPLVVAGHSAGAAIAIRATLDGGLKPAAMISVNGALLPLGGFAGGVFSPLAKLLVTQSWVPRLMAWRAGNWKAVESILKDTGSKLAPEDIEYYARLFQNRDHVAATLAMMANWDLAPLARDMRHLDTPLCLVAAGNDKAISPADSDRAAQIVKRAEVIHLTGLGHLAHEENPAIFAGLIERFAVQTGALSSISRDEQ